MIAVMLASCSEDSISDGADGDLLQVGAMHSRAAGEIEDGTTIRIFLSSAAETVDGSIVKTGDNVWRSTARVKKDVQYYIYGYMPIDAVGSATVSPVLAGISAGATLQLNDVTALTQDDICVIVGVQDMANRTDPYNVRLGTFRYLGKDRGKNFVSLLLDHIQSSIHFELQVDNAYSQLRTIKVKKAEVMMDLARTCDMTVTLQANDTESNPVTHASYTPKEGETILTIFESEDGEALSSSVPLTFDVNFLSYVKNNLSLRTTYDVYDSAGNYIHTRTAVNKLGAALPTLQLAEQTTLTMTVKPTYLYILSDPDLNNPTVTIDN